MVFGLFSSKAKKQEKQEARILKRIEEAKASFRDEIASETRTQVRQDAERALAPFGPLVLSMLNAWFETVRTKLNALYGSTFSERVSARRQQALAQVETLMQGVAERAPKKLIETQMTRYKQELAKQVRDSAAGRFDGLMRLHTTELLRVISQSPDLMTVLQKEMLPMGTRFLLTAKKSKSRVYIIEQLPMVRTIRDGRKGERSSIRSYRLAFPYVVFAVTVDNAYGHPTRLQVFFRNTPLRSLQDPLYQAALTNTHQDGVACTKINTDHLRNATVAERVDFVINEFWSSSFNQDLVATVYETRAQIPQVETYEKWEKETRKDAHFVLTLPWLEASGSRTVESFLNQLSSTRDRSTDLERRHAVLQQEIQTTVSHLGEAVAQTTLQLINATPFERVAVDAISAPIKEAYVASCNQTEQMLQAFVQSVFDELPSRDELNASSERFKEELFTAVRTRLARMGGVYGVETNESIH